jgi:DNA polymerase III alpha subunit
VQATDFDAHEARVCINSGHVLADPKRPRLYSAQQYLRSPAEMQALFADIPAALENTIEIAKRCNVSLTLGKNYLPQFPIPDGMTEAEYFCKVSQDGLEARLDFLFTDTPRGTTAFLERRKPYDERLQIELDVINKMGFPGYFLIVADFIQWAKDNGIPVGPGRGSGAGSLVAYALKITDLDPLAYDLLFERFLNPERVSMPDFDIDFCMDNRDKVIDYVAQTYGRNQVSQIITYGSMAAKAVVRDVGRVLGHPYGFVDRVAKLIPFVLGITLEDALGRSKKAQDDSERVSPELCELYEKDEEVKALLDLALSLEGLSRNTGKHAGGVLISPSDLTDFTPILCEETGEGLVSQFDKNDVEEIGLVKFDFLGLRNLTIIDWALQTINRQQAAKGLPPVDINRIPLDDKPSYDLLKAQKTTAVFQLESRGMKDLIRRLQPDVFEDIIALVALFRPGPLQSGMVDDFINRKKGIAAIEYPHPSLEQILKPTYGVIVYQEQVMQIAQVLASYTLGGADMLRRAMGKKKPEEMAKQRSIFMEGARSNNIDDNKSGYIFDLMEKFAEYGFNKTLDQDTEVYTLTGIKKIKDCKAGDQVISVDINGNYSCTDVIALHDHGQVPLWEIQFDDGTIERCTLDHKWLTENGQQPLWQIIRMGSKVWGSPTYKARYTRSPEAMPCLYEHDSFRPISRQGKSDALWSDYQNPQRSQYPFSKLCRLPKHTQRNTNTHLQGIAAYPRNAPQIFRNCKEDFSSYRYSIRTGTTFDSLEKTASKRVQKYSSQSSCFTQIVQDGSMARTSSGGIRFYAQYPISLPNGTQANRLRTSPEKNGNRSRWPLAFSTYSFRTTFANGTSTRSFAESRDYEKVLALNPAFDGMLQKQLWRAYLSRTEPANSDYRQWQLGWNTVLRKPVRAMFVGWSQGYDLEVAHAEHNFLLASGLCCSNSHSAAYALVAFQTAWLKAHYPAAFMAAVLSADMDNTDKVVTLLDDCRQLNLTTLPPDINRSDFQFTVDEQNRIIYGLGALKGAGEAALSVLLQERQQNGLFKSLSDVCKRANSQKVNKRVLETLIKSGAFDSLGGTRRAMLAFLPEAMRMAEQHHRDQLKGQTDLFGGMFGGALGASTESMMPDLPEFPEKERLQLEKETLGLYLTGHPLDEYKQEIEGLPNRMPLADLAEDEHTKYKKQAVMLAGLVSSIRTQNTDNGKRAFVQLDDNTAYYEALIFTDTYAQYAELLEKDNCVVIEGVLDTNFSGKTRLKVEKIHNMQSVRENFLRRVYFKINHAQQACFSQLKPYLIASDNPKHQIIIDYQGVNAKAELRLGNQWQVALSDEQLKAMREILDKDQLRLVF